MENDKFQYSCSENSFGKRFSILPGNIEIWHSLSSLTFSKEQAEKAAKIIVQALNDNIDEIGYNPETKDTTSNQNATKPIHQ